MQASTCLCVFVCLFVCFESVRRHTLHWGAACPWSRVITEEEACIRNSTVFLQVRRQGGGVAAGSNWEEKEGRGGERREGRGGGGRDWEYSLSSAPQFSNTQLEKGKEKTGWLDISARRAWFYLRRRRRGRKGISTEKFKGTSGEGAGTWKKPSTPRKVKKNKWTQHHLVAILASASENFISG